MLRDGTPHTSYFFTLDDPWSQTAGQGTFFSSFYLHIPTPCIDLAEDAYDLIEELGNNAIFYSQIQTTYVPSTGIATIDTLPITRKISPPQVHIEYTNTGTVVFSGVKFYLAACSLDFDPHPGMIVEIDDDEYIIERRLLYWCTGVPAAYEIIAKK